MRLGFDFWKPVLLTIVGLGVVLSVGFCAMIDNYMSHPLGSDYHWGTIQYRETLNFEVDGEPYAVSSVYKQDFISSNTDNGSRLGSRFAGGEAQVVDFGAHGRMYKLLRWGLHPELIARACGIEGYGVAHPKDRTQETFINDTLLFEGKCERPSALWPMMARFADETDPTTVEFIYPMELMEATDGAVELKSIVYERTTDPIAAGVLVQYLPWLAEPEEIVWARVPRLKFRHERWGTILDMSWFIKGE